MLQCLVLCGRRDDERLRDLGVKLEDEAHWLPICIDLRAILSIRQRGMDGDDECGWTVMETPNDLMYTVNVSLQDLMPHFVATRK